MSSILSDQQARVVPPRRAQPTIYVKVSAAAYWWHETAIEGPTYYIGKCGKRILRESPLTVTSLTRPGPNPFCHICAGRMTL